MKYITFGTFDVHLLYPFLVLFFYTLRDISYKGIYTLNFLTHPLLKTLLMFLSEIISSIFEIIRCCSSKSSIKSQELIIENNEFIDNNKRTIQPTNWKEPKIYF